MTLPSFNTFFREVWGYDPYPWQSRLARQVQESGWPPLLDIPTGAGKTAVLDIALYHLIVDRGRHAPRRLVLVVDRRVIVDQAADRAEALRTAIEQRESLSAVRSALGDMVGANRPLLQTALMRGGIVRSESWADYPHVPLLAASTVDQVGSRLLFRGYGVSDSMRPIHAGLLGCDTLLFLDEVHLARPFASLLAQLDSLRGPETEVPRRFQVVQLSATPPRACSSPDSGVLKVEGRGASKARAFTLEQDDRQQPSLARILRAPKPALLEEVPVKARDLENVKREAVAERAAEHARALIAEGRNAVGVVVNRVHTARRVWALLEDEDFDRTLLTGRMRPLDQAAAVRRIRGRVVAGREPAADARPLVVVATQCIEAGADYDFDGLVTECASLDALRQRFGRLDRRGSFHARAALREGNGGAHHDRRNLARAVVLISSDLARGGKDAVYGDALHETWSWLREIASDDVVDFGIQALQSHLEGLGSGLARMVPEARHAAVLLPAYLEQWAQTNPRPHADPEPGVFLHGIHDGRTAMADVQIIWRANLTEADLERAASDPTALEQLLEELSIVPPASGEGLSLPVWTARQFLSAARRMVADSELSDVEGGPNEPHADDKAAARPVLFWSGRNNSTIGSGRDLATGSTVLVPAVWGGLGPHGTFDPEARAPVSDLGDAVQYVQRGRPTVRLDSRVLAPWLPEETFPDIKLHGDGETDVRAALRDVLDDVVDRLDDTAPSWLRDSVAQLRESPRYIRAPFTQRWVAFAAGAPRRGSVGGRESERPKSDAATGEEDETFTGLPMMLADHLDGVASLAADFASRAHLPRGIKATLLWAGRLHDLGKADPRFQLMLHGGDEISARFGGVLAKSRVPWQDVAARRAGRIRAGYPQGQRHELVSLNMIENASGLRDRVEADGADWELLLHLVATHHGWCRPLAPVVKDETGEPVAWSSGESEFRGRTDHGFDALDSGLADRFWRLNTQYGWHELAYLEAMLRLADHRNSGGETA